MTHELATGDGIGGGNFVPRLVGYSRYGAPMYLGGGGGPIEMEVDDNDDDDDTGDDLFDTGRGSARRTSRQRDDDDDDTDDEEDLGRSTRRAVSRSTRKPAKQQARRNEPDDEDDDDLDDDEQDDDGDEWTPPTRQQFEKVEAALTKANREAAKRRTVGKAMDKFGIDGPEAFTDFLLSRGIDPETGNRLVGDDEDPDEQYGEEETGDDGKTKRRGRTREEVARDLKRAEQRGRAAAEEELKPGIALFAADSALRAAGFDTSSDPSGRKLTRALKLLDPDEFEIYLDDNGWPMVSGVDEQVKALQEDYPEWFRQPRSTRRVGDTDRRDRYESDDEDDRPVRRRRAPSGGSRQVDGGERRRSAAPKKKGWLEQLNQRMEGRG